MSYSNYHIGDALIRIKNACLAGYDEVKVTNTKSVRSVLDVLKREGFVESVSGVKNEIEVKLKRKKGSLGINDIILVSTPGRRIYIANSDVKSRHGIATLILSTPKGMKSGREAIKLGLGGELIAEVT